MYVSWKYVVPVKLGVDVCSSEKRKKRHSKSRNGHLKLKLKIRKKQQFYVRINIF
jgi:hypothetical protein